MIVELKKVKITKSIFDQIQLGSNALYFNLLSYEILGWCRVLKKGSYYRYVLLQHTGDKSLVKLRYIESEKDVTMKDINVQESDGKGGYIWPSKKVITLRWTDWNNSVTYQQSLETDLQMIESMTKVISFIRSCKIAGQIYL